MRESRIRVGTTVTVIKPNGEAIRHKTKEEIRVPHSTVTVNAVDPTGAMNSIDCGSLTYKNMTVVFYWYDLERVEECTCGGKGIMDEVMYGFFRGSRYKTKCSSVCTFKKAKAR